MEATKSHDSGHAHPIVDVLERLAREANHERQAIGYPDRCGKISYSQAVRHLAAEAFLHGFSANVIASTAGVQVQTAQKWSKVEQDAPFRELRIVPSHEPESGLGQKDAEEQERGRGGSRRSLEFVFPSGVRLFISRDDIDEALLGIIIRGTGV
jgi:hypothetical protein